jgi:hypothetical protein
MADIGGITINVGVTISEEAVQMCCQILQMYLSVNPNKELIFSRDEFLDRDKFVKVCNVFVQEAEKK